MVSSINVELIKRQLRKITVMFAIGDRVRVIFTSHPHSNCEGHIIEIRSRGYKRDQLLNVEIDIITDYIRTCYGYKERHTLWFYDSYLEKIDNYPLPSGVYRCKCGATTTSYLGVCCDCKTPQEEDCPY
jgi:hypothetical protein